MNNQDLPEDFIRKLKAVTNKRPRTVIDHILKNGYITTEELKTLYGYQHPPRAARDVREEGIPLETFRVTDSSGRSIGAYRFANISEARFGRLGGRKIFPKDFKTGLIKLLGCKCSICLDDYEDRYLQVDHRVPYEVTGDDKSLERDYNGYMLLCGSCNRAKSWSCEHCVNWSKNKKPDICGDCYWAQPDSYKHIAMREIRRLDIVWHEEEVADYEELKRQSDSVMTNIPDFVKAVLKKHIRRIP